jgi:cell division septation protein DedD
MVKEKYPSGIEAGLIPELERRGYEFTVQVGAYGDRHNAIRISRSLKNQGFPVYVFRDEDDPAALYKVVVGKFKDVDSAGRLVEKLKASGFPARRFP